MSEARARMRGGQWVTWGVGVAVVATSATAVYYRQQAARLRQERDAAIALAGQPEPRPAAAPLPRTARPDRTPAPAASRPATAPTAEPVPVREPGVAVTNAPPPRPERGPGGDRRRDRGAEWFEALRTNQPARYAEMQRRRLDMRERAQSAWEQTTTYLLNRDTSRMVEAEVAEYNRLLALLDETRTLGERMQGNLAPEDRWALMRNVHSNLVELAPLLDNERDREIQDLAIALGHSEEEAGALVEYVNQIVSNTSVRSIFPGVGRGGMHGEGPPDHPPGD